MTSRGVFYEGLAWAALWRLFGAGVQYEPSRERHTCQRHCPHRASCFKPRVLERLIHTTPDFLAPGEPPLFAHVCYWDSKETSHAKFWRTLSEIAELKLFVPDSQSLAIVFEAQRDGESFAASGWYEQFLEALRAIFDRSVFFDSPRLPRDYQRVRRRLGQGAGAAAIHELMRLRKHKYGSVDELSHAIQSAEPASQPCFDAPAMWRLEQDFCGALAPEPPAPHEGHRLRNATLQLVLLMGVFRLECLPLIDRLQAIAMRPDERFDGREEFVEALAQLPIARQAGVSQYVLSNRRRGLGRASTGDFSDDLTWLLDAWHNQTPPLGKTVFLRGLEATRDALLTSPQVIECVESLRELLERGDAFAFADWKPAQWVAAYESVPPGRHYNRYAELLIEAVGLGTYPLVRALEQRWPKESVTRFDVRALYSNRRTPNRQAQCRRLLRRIARLLPDDVDWRQARKATCAASASAWSAPNRPSTRSCVSPRRFWKSVAWPRGCGCCPTCGCPRCRRP